MTTRLAVTLAIPVIGLVTLLALLAFAGRSTGDRSVQYEGRTYTGGAEGGAAAAARLQAVPTSDRIDGLQVWLRHSTREPGGPPTLLLLEQRDGRFRIYTPVEP